MPSSSSIFAPRGDEATVETGTQLMPKFDDNGLITVVVADSERSDILMVAHMNAEALTRTIETREAWFWSRSRGRLWRKGEESGNTLAVSDIRVDCDQDAILLKVTISGDGVACHQGYRSCFYRSVVAGTPATLEVDQAMRRVTKA